MCFNLSNSSAIWFFDCNILVFVCIKITWVFRSIYLSRPHLHWSIFQWLITNDTRNTCYCSLYESMKNALKTKVILLSKQNKLKKLILEAKSFENTLSFSESFLIVVLNRITILTYDVFRRHYTSWLFESEQNRIQ